MTSTALPNTLTRWNFVPFLAAAFLILVRPPLASAQDPPAAASPDKPDAPSKDIPTGPSLFENWKTQLDLGARNYDLYGGHAGKFLENRDVTRGFFVNGAALRYESAHSPYSFWFDASNIRELDETIKTDIWKVGAFRTSFLWDRIPRFYGEGKSLFQTSSPGNLIVSPSIRAALQSVVDGQNPSAISPALAPLIKQELSAAAFSDIRTKRDQAGLRQSFRIGDHWEFHVLAKTTFNRGTRPKGAGTFARQNNGPAGDGVWESIAVELPEPVQYRTTDFKAGAVASGAKWRFGFDYGFTLFRNNVGTLTYQNPFRVTDAVGIDAAGNPSPGSAIGRNRFVTQQLSLPPDTDYHSLTVWWGFDLPRKTQFRGLFSWGQSSQNDPFLPYTQNTALVGTGIGLANNLPQGTSVLNVSSLPQRSLNGQVRNLNFDSTLVSKPWKNMNFRVQYRDEDMKNKSPSIVFPGFSRFGESHWVTGPGDYYNVPIRNFPSSFVKQDAIATWEWNAASWVTWRTEYQYENWKRTFRDAPRTEENSIRGRLDFKLPRKAKLVTDYTFSNRELDAYRTVPMLFNPTLNGGSWEVTAATRFDPTVPLEFSQLRRFDEAGRKRYDAKAILDVPLGEKLSFSGSYRFLRNNYTKGFYGMQFDDQGSFDGAVNFSIGERTFLYYDVSWQRDRYRNLGLGHLIIGAVSGVTGCCAQYPVANTWDRSSRSNLYNFQTGINWATNGEKTTIDLSYGVSFARDRIHAFNPYPILANSPRTAGAYDYPDTVNRFQEVRFSLSRKLRPGLELGIQYRFEAYQLDDFFLNGLEAYSQGLVVRGGVATNLPRQLILNARFGTYHSHQEGVFLRYSF